MSEVIQMANFEAPRDGKTFARQLGDIRVSDKTLPTLARMFALDRVNQVVGFLRPEYEAALRNLWMGVHGTLELLRAGNLGLADERKAREILKKNLSDILDLFE